MNTLSNFCYSKDHIYNAQKISILATEAVPVLKAVNFAFLETKKGYIKSILPLNQFSSNQHGTHQAMILAMGGDYTGGLALATLLGEEPILGIHEVQADKAMSLWLLASNMEYLYPSTDDVFIEASIDINLEEALKQKYESGATIVLDVDVLFSNTQNRLVAKGTFKYFANKKSALAVFVHGKRINIMFEHMLKTSAKLIAQLRANEANEVHPLFIDEISPKVAGKQGQVIANRFVKMLPELQHLVAARTFHLDEMLRKYAEHITQIVFVGAGLDFRTYRQNQFFSQHLIFELDLQEMIDERIYLENQFNLQAENANPPQRISCNFLSESIAEKLIIHGFDPLKPSFFIYEGCAMYFTKEENKKILSEIAQLMQYNDKSLLWIDKVNEAAINQNLSTPSLHHFLANMAKLGEPFIFGFDAENSLINEVGLVIVEEAYTTDIKDNLPPSDIYGLYSFNVLKFNTKAKN